MQVLREEWTEKAQSKLFDLEPLTDELIKGVMLELESFQKLLARHATTSSADVTWVEQQLQQMWLFRLLTLLDGNHQNNIAVLWQDCVWRLEQLFQDRIKWLSEKLSDLAVLEADNEQAKLLEKYLHEVSSIKRLLVDSFWRAET
jgi:hypothetical protein